ncbi:MAG: hypothetical protein KF893_06415 [Caldilineaceae bacterium]|nr:hypothetical protein [Caldilineaceae bacterium]
MYNRDSVFVRFGRYGSRVNRFAGNIGGWFLVMPGISLLILGLSILIWPELLAYMVAGLMMVAGATLAVWGWRLTVIQKEMKRRMQNTIYQEQRYYDNSGTPYERF